PFLQVLASRIRPTHTVAVSQRGSGVDAGCRAFDINGVVTESVYVAGDIAHLELDPMVIVPRRQSGRNEVGAGTTLAMKPENDGVRRGEGRYSFTDQIRAQVERRAIRPAQSGLSRSEQLRCTASG